ncbi:MAG: ABC transporter substrate-binding protein [Chloroflexi bacterium]|nr:ABC transporter substrate-binding protein [Chloroflexota bacterium]
MYSCRRLPGIVAALAMSLALLLVVAACGSDDGDGGTTTATTTTSSSSTSTSAAPAPTAAPAEAPSGGDTMPMPAEDAMMPKATVDRLIFATTAPSTEHSDQRVLCCFNALQLRPMYENLLAVNPAGEFVPGLATSWALEPDGQSMRLELQEGVEFHNGNGQYTADDVINFFNEFVSFEDAHVFSRIFWNAFTESIEKVDDHEIVFRMKSPNSFLLLALSDRWTQLPVVSKADWDANGAPETPESTPLAGTGPYQFADRAQGQFVLFENAPGEHWRAEPDFNELELRWISEISTRLSSLLAGEVHMADIPPDLQGQAIGRDYKVLSNSNFGTRVWMQFYAAFPHPETGVAGWPLYPDAKLLDVRVRKALNKAINREEVLGVFAPHGELMILNHFHPQFTGWNPEWEQRFDAEYGYDPAASRALLREAGYGPNNPLQIKTRIRSCVVMAGCEDVTEAIAGYWQDVDIDVDLVTIDAAARNALSRATRGGTAGVGEGIVDWVDIDNSSTHPVFALANRQTWLATGGVNGFATPEMAEFVGRIQSEMDWNHHEPNIRAVGELSYNLHANVPLWYLPAQVTVDPNVIESYVWNGTEHGTFTHLEEIVAVKK